MKTVIQIVGMFYPTSLQQNVIQLEFTQWCRAKLGIDRSGYHADTSYGIMVHPPSTSYKNSIGSTAWHRDCGGRSYWLIVWSNCYPTQLRFKDRIVLNRVPYNAVIMIDNHKCEHRLHPNIPYNSLVFGVRNRRLTYKRLVAK